jgi:tetratricopeptide (TPR) repeat protein
VKLTILILFPIFITTSIFAQDDPAQQAQSLIGQNKYGEALSILNTSRRDKDLSDSLRLEILKMLVVFNERTVGDYRKVEKFLQEIIRFPAAINRPVRFFAEKEIIRLKTLNAKYRKENNFLKKIKIISMSGNKKDKQVLIKDQIENFILDNPDYYRLAEIYYYLGRNYMNLNKYGKAIRYFDKSIQLKPGINTFLPVSSHSRGAYAERYRKTMRSIYWTILAILLIITMISFYIFRPWKNFHIKHLFVCLAMIFLWWLVFTASTYFLGATFSLSQEDKENIDVEEPSFIRADPGSPGSEITRILFRYGLIGILGVYLFSLGMSRIRKRKIAGIAAVLYGFLMFGSLTGVFYIRYCKERTIYYSKGKGLFDFIKGNYLFKLKDHEVYVLSDPNSYSNLNLESIDELELVDWFVQHCHFDSLPPGYKVNNQIQH